MTKNLASSNKERFYTDYIMWQVVCKIIYQSYVIYILTIMGINFVAKES
jgi:hypothetical protein